MNDTVVIVVIAVLSMACIAAVVKVALSHDRTMRELFDEEGPGGRGRR